MYIYIYICTGKLVHPYFSKVGTTRFSKTRNDNG